MRKGEILIYFLFGTSRVVVEVCMGSRNLKSIRQRFASYRVGSNLFSLRVGLISIFSLRVGLESR